MPQPIDLRSDTVTVPTPAMRKAMFEAEVGDDVYGEDPTINRLERRAAEIFGREAAIFVPGRETLMKPHFIHPILEKGHFATYEEANAWYRKNVKAGVAVPKPAFPEVLQLIHGAGGWAALAHPGYYEKAGLKVAARLADWRTLGLDAVELDYPYHACSPREFSRESERAFIDGLRRTGEAAGLRFTRGSDSHTAGDFERVYGPLVS